MSKSHFDDFWTMSTPVDWKKLGSAFGVETHIFNADDFSAANHLSLSDGPRLTIVNVAPDGAANLWNTIKANISQGSD